MRFNIVWLLAVVVNLTELFGVDHPPPYVPKLVWRIWRAIRQTKTI